MISLYEVVDTTHNIKLLTLWLGSRRVPDKAPGGPPLGFSYWKIGIGVGYSFQALKEFFEGRGGQAYLEGFPSNPGS